MLYTHKNGTDVKYATNKNGYINFGSTVVKINVFSSFLSS